MQNAVDKGNYEPEGVGLVSLTKAARSEARKRKVAVPSKNIGTLHSFCFKLLGGPKIADIPQNLKLWNEWVTKRGYSKFQLTDDTMTTNSDDLMTRPKGSTGNKLYSRVQILRAKRTSSSFWSPPYKRWYTLWCQWKKENDFLDFADLIELCLENQIMPPSDLRILVLDECQDFSAVEWALCRMWATKLDTMIAAGDPDQCLYQWRGSDPKSFASHHIPPENVRILKQSWRIPRAVHEYATTFLLPRIQDREQVEYLPREEEGELRHLHMGSWKHPESAIQHALRYYEADKTVMFLASCSYVLSPLIQCLKKLGLPFHNPWRKKRADWNPLASRRGASSASDRLLAFLTPFEESEAGTSNDEDFLEPFTVDSSGFDWAKGEFVDLVSPKERPEGKRNTWTYNELRSWIELIRTEGVLQHGAKARIEKSRGNDEVQPETLMNWFITSELEQAIMPETRMGWLTNHLLASRTKTLAYSLKVISRRGVKALRETPRIIVGTVHSVKGAEAQCVYVFPDLSPSAWQQWFVGKRSEKDEIIRVFYVAATRARESLIICPPVAHGGHVRL